MTPTIPLTRPRRRTVSPMEALDLFRMEQAVESSEPKQADVLDGVTREIPRAALLPAVLASLGASGAASAIPAGGMIGLGYGAARKRPVYGAARGAVHGAGAGFGAGIGAGLGALAGRAISGGDPGSLAGPLGVLGGAGLGAYAGAKGTGWLLGEGEYPDREKTARTKAAFPDVFKWLKPLATGAGKAYKAVAPTVGRTLPGAIQGGMIGYGLSPEGSGASMAAGGAALGALTQAHPVVANATHRTLMGAAGGSGLGQIADAATGDNRWTGIGTGVGAALGGGAAIGGHAAPGVARGVVGQVAGAPGRLAEGVGAGLTDAATAPFRWGGNLAGGNASPVWTGAFAKMQRPAGALATAGAGIGMGLGMAETAGSAVRNVGLPIYDRVSSRLARPWGEGAAGGALEAGDAGMKVRGFGPNPETGRVEALPETLDAWKKQMVDTARQAGVPVRPDGSGLDIEETGRQAARGAGVHFRPDGKPDLGATARSAIGDFLGDLWGGVKDWNKDQMGQAGWGDQGTFGNMMGGPVAKVWLLLQALWRAMGLGGGDAAKAPAAPAAPPSATTTRLSGADWAVPGRGRYT